MVKAKLFTFQRPFEGTPKEGDLKIVEEDLPPIKNGEFLAEAVYLSVDPYMRAYGQRDLNVGDTFLGTQVAKIIDSKNPKYPVGQHVVAAFGWRTHTISDGKPIVRSIDSAPPTLLPDFGNLPLSLALGVLGMPGNSAYFGFLEVCTPRVGETVVISTAAGAVGNHVGQIAKIKGCKVVGLTSSDEKGRWLVDDLGFDHFINYKTDDVEKALSAAAPEGVDCYFDNVGGEISSIVLRHMNSFGRISVCGVISAYNGADVRATVIQRPMISRNLKMQGFSVRRYTDRANEAIHQNLKWIKEGKLKYRETVTEGFENMFTAFTGLFKSVNIGKAIVKV